MRDLQVLLSGVGVDLLVVESVEGWLDTVLLSHFEVLSEVLVSAPPVGPDHVQPLVSSDLMEVRVSHIVLLSINWESSVGVSGIVHFVGFTNSVSPVEDQSFLV